ncbi:metal ABC transporter permease [Desulforhabdus amnigena]|uniref:Membrane protein n=1 Tax=Desulforhabdus amnigena TaxID=40218 RepID=A0A9W6FV16_9BACT|nr:metal ABC transporter permease [Desulforhabdus amnigena]NLJ29431.1 metal ABC transporter permease [Deltaproteobacteria bacterium]GLI35421.1 membrane protein [Desulforhabdus amnigena]
MLEAFHMEFMRNALLAGFLTSIACGIIGTLVVVNRIVFISGGIAHAAYGGIGIAFYLGIPLLAGTTGFSLLISILMAMVTLKNKQRADTIIGVLWAVGMALGIILMDLTPGYHVDLMSYLFGSILAVPRSDLWLMIGVDLLILGTVFSCYNSFQAMSFDEEFAMTMGVPVRFLYFILLTMMALTVVMTIRVVGLILVIALLTIPPYISEKYSQSLGMMMFLSILLSSLFTFIGLWLSYSFNLTSGATIIMVAAAFFFASLFWEQLQKRME